VGIVGIIELSPLKIPIISNKSQRSFIHGGWQLFSPTLLVEMDESLLIRWVALYALASMWRR
jgi:hypothetical protein